MQNIHPLFTHFPIALLLAVPLIDLIGIIRREDWYHRASLLVLFLGVLGAIAAVTTGLLAEESVPHPDAAHSLIELHEAFALTALGLAVAMLLWRLAVRNRRSAGMLLALLAAEVLFLCGPITVTGYFGGQLVFEHGVGTALTAQEGHAHTHETSH